MTTLHICTACWAIALAAKALSPSLPWLAVLLAPLGWYALLAAGAGSVLLLALVIVGTLLAIERVIDGKAAK